MIETALGNMDNNKILTDVTTTLIKDAISTGWDRVKKFFKDLDAQQAIQYNTAYTNYLTNTYDKNGKIKTLIYRRVPKELYSFYECIGVECDGKIIDTSSITRLVEESNKIIITGTGGIGKSILFKHLFLNTIDTTDYIPVLIELRKFNAFEIKDISLYDAVYQSLCENGFKLEKEYFEDSLKEGGYIILLDGFDEINRDKVNRVTSEVKGLSDKYNENKFLISSRPTDNFIGWNDFLEMTALPLTKEQALSLINKIEFDESVKTTFYDALKESLFKRYESFASNPLLLTIMLLTFNNHASIPEKLNDFYEEAFSTLFNMHDATKDCYVRDIRSKLGCEDFKTVFAYICFKSYFAGEFEFSESRLRGYIQNAKEKFNSLQFSVDDFQEDLTLSVCMLIKDGLDYRFAHRSFQEYFAAWYTCKITDELQQKLLSSWLGESNAVVTDEYLSMLFNLQSEKVNKIILCPGIKRLKKLHDDQGFTIDLLERLFKGISINPVSREEKNHYIIALVIKDRYLCNVVQMTCRLNHYRYAQGDARDDALARQIKKKAPSRENQWSFSEVTKIVSTEELLQNLSWFEHQYQFCISILQQNADNKALHKKKVASIIDEL